MHTSKEVKEKLKSEFGSFSIRKGVFTVRKEFFYTHGITAEYYVKKVLSVFPDAKIVDSGEVWKPFRGGANTANSSHFFVKFTFGE